MGKYSDRLLEFPPAEKKTSWSERLFQEQVPTGAISTITSEPITKWNPDPEPQATWGALQKAGWVDKPEAKIQIFAASRFPELPKAERESRYRVIDGEIMYMGEDGKLHRETRSDIVSRLKAFSAGAVSDAPAIVLSAIGASGGPLLAGLGAAGGEGIKKTVGSLVFGEEQTATENLKDMSFEAGLAMLGERLGGGLASGHEKLLNRAATGKTPSLKYAVNTDLANDLLTKEEHAKAAIIKGLADAHGIDLAPHQLYDKRGMTNIWKYLREHPQTSNAVQAFEKRQQGQIESSFARFARSVSPEEDISITGKNLTDEALDIIKQSKATRTKAVSPMYKKAFEDVPELDISSEAAFGEFSALKEKLTSLSDDSVNGGAAKSALKRVKAMMADAGTNTRKLDAVKKEIDNMVSSPSMDWKTSIEKDTKTKLVDFSRGLNDLLEKNIPEYAKAKKTYGLLSPKVDQYEKSVVGRLARVKNETDLQAAATYIFGPNMTPKLISEARNNMALRNPGLWKDAIAAHLRKTYNDLVETETSEIANVAGKMHKRLFGTANKKEQMRAALGKDMYEQFEGFMKVMEHASKGIGKESMTMPFSAIDQTIGAIPGSKIYRYTMFPRQAAAETVFKKWNDIIVRGRQEELFKVLSDKDVIAKIAKLKKIEPGTKLFYKELGLLGVYMGKAEIEYGFLSEPEMQPAH